MARQLKPAPAAADHSVDVLRFDALFTAFDILMT